MYDMDKLRAVSSRSISSAILPVDPKAALFAKEVPRTRIAQLAKMMVIPYLNINYELGDESYTCCTIW
jgi:hypothetical protein